MLWDDRFHGVNAHDSHGQQQIDASNLYYRWATNMREAMQFELLHEYAHLLGMTDAGAHEYARSMIIEVRKAKRGGRARFRQFPEKETELADCAATSRTLAAEGPAPPRNNLPPGTRAKRK